MDIPQEDSFYSLRMNGYQIFDCMDDFEQMTAAHLFKSWESEIPVDLLKQCNVIKDYFNGHQAFCWYIRCLPSVMELFQNYWKNENLVVSFERALFYDISIKKKRNFSSWTSDVAYSNRGGIRAFVVVESCEGSGFCYIPGKRLVPSRKKIIDSSEKHEQLFVSLKKGQIILYDSSICSRFVFGIGRTVIQPVSYYPKKLVTEGILSRRFSMFLKNEVSTHCCYKSHILKKGVHETAQLKSDTDLILDTMYVNHEIRNSLI